MQYLTNKERKKSMMYISLVPGLPNIWSIFASGGIVCRGTRGLTTSQAFFVDDVIVVNQTYGKGRGMRYMTKKTNHKECPCSRKSGGTRDKLLQKKIKIIGPSSGKIQHSGGGLINKLCIVYYIFHGRVLQLGILDKFFSGPSCPCPPCGHLCSR